MEEEPLPDLPPSPVLSSTPSVSFSPASSSIPHTLSSADLKRKSIHTNVTVVENATRYIKKQKKK